MKIWIDDVRPAPKGYVWYHSTNEAIEGIDFFNMSGFWDAEIEIIDIDHDSGDYANDGGDYINVLKWLEKNHYSYPIRIHSMNPVGVQNMRTIIEHNNWKEVY